MTGQRLDCQPRSLMLAPATHLEIHDESERRRPLL
jgi:hypothetical protein